MIHDTYAFFELKEMARVLTELLTITTKILIDCIRFILIVLEKLTVPQRWITNQVSRSQLNGKLCIYRYITKIIFDNSQMTNNRKSLITWLHINPRCFTNLCFFQVCDFLKSHLVLFLLNRLNTCIFLHLKYTMFDGN